MGNQPEPKLIASSVSQNAASSSRVPVVTWASGSGVAAGVDRERPDVRGGSIGVDAHELRAICDLRAGGSELGEDVGHGLGSMTCGAGNDLRPRYR